jgi:anti-anti-sigma factor
VDDVPKRMTALPKGTVVVEMPAEISYSNASFVRARLTVALLAPGVTTVVANLANSTFIDSAGIREMAMAHRLAATKQAVLRIVAAPIIRRRLSLTALDQIIPVSSSLTDLLLPGRPTPEDEIAAQ